MLQKIKTDTNLSEKEWKEANEKLKRILENSANSIISKLGSLGEEILETVPLAKYETVFNEFIKIIKEQNLENSEEIIKQIQSMLDEIETLRSIIPDKFYMTNNKLSNEITKNFVDEDNIQLVVMKTPKHGEIITYNSLTYKGEHINITGKHEFTAYDRAIHNAVCSLYVAGNETITPTMVYRAVNGMSDSEKASPQAIEAISNSIDKSRYMELKVDFTKEAEARNINIEKAVIEDYLLNATKVKIKTCGNIVEGYKINKMPMLYQYAQYTKQILAVPSKLLDTKKATRNTEEIIPIKEYLVRRIEVMKHDKTMSNKILYDTIFDEAGISHPTKEKSFKLRADIKAILELWKNQKYIKNFEEYRQGKFIKGIEIFLYEKR